MKVLRRKLIQRLSVSCLAGMGLSGAVWAQMTQAELPAAQTAPASAPDVMDTAPVASGAMRASWTVEIDAPESVKSALQADLDVSRYQKTQSADGISRSELARLVTMTPDQVRELLQPLGYFTPVVTAEIVTGADAAALPNQTLRVKVVVDPGPQSVVGRLTLEVQGDAQDLADKGDVPAQQTLQEFKSTWPLTEGKTFSQAAWSSAKNAGLLHLRNGGFVTATYSGTVAEVDPDAEKVRVFVVADSGPRFYFGDLSIEGAQRYDTRAVTRLKTFEKGEIYSEKKLLDFEERMRRLGLYESVSVDMEPNPDQAASVPIVVKLKEQSRHQSTVGIGLTSNSRQGRGVEPRFTLEHIERALLGWSWMSKTKLALGGNINSVEQSFLSYPQNGFYRNLISGAYSIDKTQDNFKVENARFRIGRTQDSERIDRLYYAEWQRANTTSNGLTTGASALTANYEWVWRDLDNMLLPTKGLTSSIKGAVGRAYASTGYADGQTGNFGRLTSRLTYYRPVGNWLTQTRLEAGQILGQQDVAIPYTLLFRAGGDDSVRGYGYQTLGPTKNGAVVGGRVLGTASAEVAHPFTQRFPAFLGAVFVDVGNAALKWKDFKPKVGYGAGVRWRSPVGPLRFDVAYGHQDRQFRYHFSVGITF